MWVDIFETNNLQIPKPVDISERKPKKFQLRIIIYNTKEVILDDVNPVTGEKTSDIYVKGNIFLKIFAYKFIWWNDVEIIGFLCDKIDEAQKTDTHFRSLDGEGTYYELLIWNFE